VVHIFDTAPPIVHKDEDIEDIEDFVDNDVDFLDEDNEEI
jgi:hypothetical protein